MKFKNSDRLNHCISNTNNTRKYRLLQQYFDKVDRLPRSLPSCSRKRGLLLRKYSIPRFHFVLALSIRPRKCYYKSRPVLRQSISHRESRGEGKREKDASFTDLSRKWKTAKKVCAPGAFRGTKNLIVFFLYASYVVLAAKTALSESASFHIDITNGASPR